jgi:hypothetical protein
MCRVHSAVQPTRLMGTRSPPDRPTRALLESLRMTGSISRLDLTVCTSSCSSSIYCMCAHHFVTSKWDRPQASILQRVLFDSAFNRYHEYGRRHWAVSVSLNDFPSTNADSLWLNQVCSTCPYSLAGIYRDSQNSSRYGMEIRLSFAPLLRFVSPVQSYIFSYRWCYFC